MRIRGSLPSSKPKISDLVKKPAAPDRQQYILRLDIPMYEPCPVDDLQALGHLPHGLDGGGQARDTAVGHVEQGPALAELLGEHVAAGVLCEPYQLHDVLVGQAALDGGLLVDVLLQELEKLCFLLPDELHGQTSILRLRLEDLRKAALAQPPDQLVAVPHDLLPFLHILVYPIKRTKSNTGLFRVS